MLSEESMIAYAEIDEILKHMNSKYVEKVPKKLREFFATEKSHEYVPNIDPRIPLKEQNLTTATLEILASLNINYWCANEEKKKELLLKYAEQEAKVQAELREKYNPDNIFSSDANMNNNSIIDYSNTNISINKADNLYSFNDQEIANKKIFGIFKK